MDGFALANFLFVRRRFGERGWHRVARVALISTKDPVNNALDSGLGPSLFWRLNFYHNKKATQVKMRWTTTSRMLLRDYSNFPTSSSILNICYRHVFHSPYVSLQRPFSNFLHAVNPEAPLRFPIYFVVFKYNMTSDL